MRGVSIGILAAMLAVSRADDVLSDDLGDGVELMIHLDFSQYTDRFTTTVISEKNSAKAKLQRGSWQRFNVP